MPAVSVGTTAVQADTGFSAKSQLLIQNLGAGAVYFGRTNTVTTSSGIQIAASGGTLLLTAARRSGLGIYLIAASGTQDVRVDVID